MGFIKWFKQSLEDEKGQASFRRIYNWLLSMLVAFLVIWHAYKHDLSQLIITELLILLAAVFLNTSVITVDNILRFFGRGGNSEPAPVPAPPAASIPVTRVTTLVETPTSNNNETN